MNTVILIGRLTRDPEVRYGDKTGTAVARFSVAIDRGKDKEGKDRGADFPNVVCFGRLAEIVGKNQRKGRLVGVSGHLQTGSYEKDGQKYYTTEVFANRVEFLDFKDSSDEAPQGFSKLEDDQLMF